VLLPQIISQRVPLTAFTQDESRRHRLGIHGENTKSGENSKTTCLNIASRGAPAVPPRSRARTARHTVRTDHLLGPTPDVTIFGSFGNAVAFQQAVEFPSVDTEDASGAGFVAVLLAENCDDVRFLKIVQTRRICGIAAVCCRGAH
jgi:hypothetical protein